MDEKKHRQDFELTYKDMQQLTAATHSFQDKETARKAVSPTWRRIARKYGFFWETAGPPVRAKSAKFVSAIPHDTELTESQLLELGVSQEQIDKHKK